MNGGGYCGGSIVDEFVPHGSLDMPHIDHADWQVHSRCRLRHCRRRCHRCRRRARTRVHGRDDGTKRRDRISFRVYGNVLFADVDFEFDFREKRGHFFPNGPQRTVTTL